MAFSDVIDVICVMVASAVFAKAIRRGRERYNDVVTAREEAREAPPVNVSALVSGEEARGAKKVVVSRPVVAKRAKRVDTSPVRREDLDGCPPSLPPPPPPFELTVGSTTARVWETHAVQPDLRNQIASNISRTHPISRSAPVLHGSSFSTHTDSISTHTSSEPEIQPLVSHIDEGIPRYRIDADFTPRGTRVRRKLSFGTESPISDNSAESTPPHVVSRCDSDDDARAWCRAHPEADFTPRGTRVRRKLSFRSSTESAKCAPPDEVYALRVRQGAKRKRIVRRLRAMFCVGAKVSE